MGFPVCFGGGQRAKPQPLQLCREREREREVSPNICFYVHGDFPKLGVPLWGSTRIGIIVYWGI